MQEICNSSVLAMELQFSSFNPSIYNFDLTKKRSITHYQNYAMGYQLQISRENDNVLILGTAITTSDTALHVTSWITSFCVRYGNREQYDISDIK